MAKKGSLLLGPTVKSGITHNGVESPDYDDKHVRELMFPKSSSAVIGRKEPDRVLADQKIKSY